MLADTTTALVATTPLSWLSPWGSRHETNNFGEEPGRSNGIVYVGVEANRTRQSYDRWGIATQDTAALGQLVDIYV